ncbi:hypothetical protein [Reyranella sp.]|uniref:hypothetical protein n=1 Tax=Reyranella sp. TaxID=1929291 RepID=UPI004035390C
MTAETPPLSRLFREGFRHWCSHQRDFWLFAAFAIPGIAFFRITNTGTIALAILFTLALDRWLKLTMFADLRQRTKLLAKSKGGPSLIVPSGGVWGFCLAYGFVMYVAGLTLLIVLAPGVSKTGLVAATVISAATMLLTSLVFSPQFLAPAASVAGVKWDPREAIRESRGVRASLVSLVILCTLIDLAVPLLFAFSSTALPQPSSTFAIGFAGLVAFIDLFALYFLAYGTARLFMAKTGWQPEPLPVA